MRGKNMKMYLISSENVWEQLQRDHGGKGGAYKLHCLDKSDQNRVEPLNRVLGLDNEGILYIGETSKNHFRIGDLIKSLSPHHKSLGHHAGIRFSNNIKLRERFPFERLCFTFIPAENPKEKESQELQRYFQKYGEVPPLNATES